MNNKQVVIRTNDRKFYSYWMLFTAPFHKLSPQEREVTGQLIYYYYKFNTKITDEKLIWKMILNYETKNEIKEYLDMDTSGFQNIFTSLRKKNVLIKTRGYEEIKKSFIPKLSDDFKQFDLTYRLIIDEEGK